MGRGGTRRCGPGATSRPRWPDRAVRTRQTGQAAGPRWGRRCRTTVRSAPWWPNVLPRLRQLSAVSRRRRRRPLVTSAARAYLLRLPKADDLLTAAAGATAASGRSRPRVAVLERELRRCDREARACGGRARSRTVERRGRPDRAGAGRRAAAPPAAGAGHPDPRAPAIARGQRRPSSSSLAALTAERDGPARKPSPGGNARRHPMPGPTRRAERSAAAGIGRRSAGRLRSPVGVAAGRAGRRGHRAAPGMGSDRRRTRRRPMSSLPACRAPPSESERTADPSRLTAWAGLPGAHLIVDGYNVTKTGFPELTLSEQRDRLVRSLAALAARTSAEVTVVFDGAAVATSRPSGRGIRVLFSPPGVLADDVIRDLVRAEPRGRVVVVVSSDREVVDRPPPTVPGPRRPSCCSALLAGRSRRSPDGDCRCRDLAFAMRVRDLRSTGRNRSCTSIAIIAP